MKERQQEAQQKRPAASIEAGKAALEEGAAGVTIAETAQDGMRSKHNIESVRRLLNPEQVELRERHKRTTLRVLAFGVLIK